MTTPNKVALVVGAQGVIGRNLVEHLASLDDWEVIGLSRRGGPSSGRVSHLAVDLLDAADARQKLAALTRVTHVFYAAYQPRPTRAEEVAPNLAMLRHAIDLGEAHAGSLQLVVLVTGGKYYGLQWGAIKTPARETDARHLGPNFYYAQQDHLAERAAAAGWDWTHLIPPYVTGFSERAPMNLAMAIGVLATLSREQGLALRFPGPAASWHALHHLADAAQIAAAAAWSVDSPAAASQIFNVANGDPARWCHTWPAIADHFGLAAGEPLPVPLTQVAAECGPLWRHIAERDGLRQPDLHALVDWQWADYMFKTAFSHDVLFELGKIRRAGFAGCVDSEAALRGRFAELRERRLIP